MDRKLEQTIIARKVRAGTIYKLIMTGLAVSTLPLGVLAGVAGAMGADSVRINGRAIHGAEALLWGPLITVVSMTLLGLVLATAVCVGLWAVSLFRPIAVRVVVDAPPTGAEGPDLFGPDSPA
ncbi:hypothetical protein [Paludisphaera sp.]|uniref:hypothetical protein n=1 Tax=Paludisphaera sp. TaxID=2017432 RepID=UPI00301B91D4